MRPCAYACIAAIYLAQWTDLVTAAEQLRWKFKPGEQLHYRMRQDTQSRTQIGERDLKSSVQQVVDQSWRVKTVADDGTADVGLTLDRMLIKYDTPNGVIQLDTAGKVPAVGDLASVDTALRALTGTELAVKMSPQGEITEITLPENVQKLLGGANGGDPLQSGISEDGLKAMITQSSVVMPKEAVQPGFEWSDEKNQLGAKLILHYQYAGQAEAANVQLATVDITGEITLQPQPVPELSIKLAQQDVKGVIHFDATAGRLQDMEMTQKTAVDIASGETTGRQEVQVVISSRLVDPNEAPPASETPAATEAPADKP